jgi:hypothetical protein
MIGITEAIVRVVDALGSVSLQDLTVHTLLIATTKPKDPRKAVRRTANQLAVWDILVRDYQGDCCIFSRGPIFENELSRYKDVK